MEVGEVWAYRARGLDPLVAVEVVKHGTKKPARVLVRFVDSEFEGREGWVPPGRLKVLWSGVADFEAEEARWEAVTAEPPHDAPETHAAEVVFEQVVDRQMAVLDYSHRCPYLRVVNAQAMADWLGWLPSEFRGHPAAFDDDGGDLVAPWSTALALAQRAVQISPKRILDLVDKEERDAAREAIHGHRHTSGRGNDEWFMEPATFVEYENEYGRPVRDLLRGWCGAAAITERDELNALRQEIRRVGGVAEEAIEALRATGAKRDADRLSAKLGTPVEALPASD